MSDKTICLVDEAGEVRYFQQQALLDQLAVAEISVAGAIKSAARNLGNKVREMRKAQSEYFSATYGTPEKDRALRKSKELEKTVDAMLKQIDATMEKLSQNN